MAEEQTSHDSTRTIREAAIDDIVKTTAWLYPEWKDNPEKNHDAMQGRAQLLADAARELGVNHLLQATLKRQEQPASGQRPGFGSRP